MKKHVLLFVSVLALFLNSCTSMKNTSKTSGLYDTTWELEYISGPRIAFDGLFPHKKPFIKLEKSTNRASGNTGCNGFNAQFKLEGNAISFQPGATTMMHCEGGGEQQFLKTIQQIDSYSIDQDGKLNLNMKDIAMMRFKKVADQK
ncbi:META domain-containing protein [Flavobacterium sp. JP2137]|uniref:META domain-containing protein n=1 Tax=Flavobacterium sp. JP2137 TaxID=3414510 RepID=UPI003D2FB972